MNESEETTPEQNNEGVSPTEIGKALTQARERCELTQEQLAKKLNLTMRKLGDLENGEFDKLGAPIFVRGYIKAYCKVVGIDPSELLQAYEPKQETNTQASMQSFSKRTEKEAHDNRLMLFSYIIIAIIIGSSLYWLWQNSDSSVEQSSTSNAASVAEMSRASKLEEQPQSRDEAQQDLNQAQNSESLSESLQQQPEAADSSAQLDDTMPSGVDAQATQPTIQQVARSKPSEVLSEPLAPGEQKVIMRFSGECWVEVQDAKGKRLAYDIKRAGQAIELIGVAPFAVTLGKHDVVEITLNGNAVDISQFPKNRLAKFSLPLTE